MKLKLFILLILICEGFAGCRAQKYHIPEYSQYKVYTNLSKALKNKDDVKILVLANKNMKEFPLKITELTNLKILNLTNNKIRRIPKEISKLKNLERLELMKNELEGLPHEIVNVKNLKRINVSYNYISEEDVKFIKEALPECFIITEILL